MLLRGSVLRNIDAIVGLVLYTGQNTKVMLNSGETPSKRSMVEKQMNLQVRVVGSCDELRNPHRHVHPCAILETIYLHIWILDDTPWVDPTQSPVAAGIFTFGAILMMLPNFVPTSLYITIEGVRTIQASGLNASERAAADAIATAELTNALQTHVPTRYIAPRSTFLAANLPALLVSPQFKPLHDFFTILAVCHTAPNPTLTQLDTGRVDVGYSAQSPDEQALVAGARDVGFAFVERRLDEM
ncbi:hypothetical protein BDK51DRAFT_29748, partial [Blyttiomyces helicus]